MGGGASTANPEDVIVLKKCIESMSSCWREESGWLENLTREHLSEYSPERLAALLPVLDAAVCKYVDERRFHPEISHNEAKEHALVAGRAVFTSGRPAALPPVAPLTAAGSGKALAGGAGSPTLAPLEKGPRAMSYVTPSGDVLQSPVVASAPAPASPIGTLKPDGTFTPKQPLPPVPRVSPGEAQARDDAPAATAATNATNSVAGAATALRAAVEFLGPVVDENDAPDPPASEEAEAAKKEEPEISMSELRRMSEARMRARARARAGGGRRGRRGRAQPEPEPVTTAAQLLGGLRSYFEAAEIGGGTLYTTELSLYEDGTVELGNHDVGQRGRQVQRGAAPGEEGFSEAFFWGGYEYYTGMWTSVDAAGAGNARGEEGGAAAADAAADADAATPTAAQGGQGGGGGVYRVSLTKCRTQPSDPYTSERCCRDVSATLVVREALVTLPANTTAASAPASRTPQLDGATATAAAAVEGATGEGADGEVPVRGLVLSDLEGDLHIKFKELRLKPGQEKADAEAANETQPAAN